MNMELKKEKQVNQLKLKTKQNEEFVSLKISLNIILFLNNTLFCNFC